MFRQMALVQAAGKALEEAPDQNRIAVADLSRFGRLIRRHEFVAGGEMADPKPRADQRLHATDRCEQGQRARIDPGPLPGQDLALANIFTAPAYIDRSLPAHNPYPVAGAFDIFLHHHT